MSKPSIAKFTSNIAEFSQEHCGEGSLYNATVEAGQSAKTMVVSCSDSLVGPCGLMKVEPGELFVHRNIAGLVPPYQDGGNSECGTSAALEHGVKNLEVEDLIVMGHGFCGGIKSMLEESSKQPSAASSISSWMEIAAPAKRKMREEHPEITDFEEQRHFCEKEAVKISLDNLMTYPVVKKRVAEGTLSLHGWHFDRGTFSTYNAEKKRVLK